MSLRLARKLGGVWSIHLRNVRRMMRVQEFLDPGNRVDEVFCKLCQGNLANDDKQRNAVLDYGGKLVRCVADAFVVSERDAVVASAVLEPLLVRPVGREKVMVPLDGQAGGGENFREAFAEVAVREIDTAHAARS